MKQPKTTKSTWRPITDVFSVHHLLVSPSVKLSPCVTLLLVTFSHHTQFFFTTSYLLSRHFANLTPPPPPGLPTCLPTLSFTIKSENDAFRLSYDQQPPLRGFLRRGFFHFYFRSAIRLSQHFIFFQPLRQTDSARNPGATSIQFQGRTISNPFSWISRGWEFFALVLHSDCRTSAGGTSLLCSPELQQLCSHLLAPVSFPEEWES